MLVPECWRKTMLGFLRLYTQQQPQYRAIKK